MIGCGRRKVLVIENLLSEFYDCHVQGTVKSGVKNDVDLEGCGPSIVAMKRDKDLEEKVLQK